ncbi:MAG: DMT family transporter [Candidatus Lokiarchaeota archaeon]
MMIIFSVNILNNRNLKKGVIFGAIAAFLIGLQPVIANSRPDYIDPYIFAAITALIEAFIFLPLFFLERKKLKSNLNDFPKQFEIYDQKLNGWKKKKNIILILGIGLTFTIVPIILYTGFRLAGTINASLTLKTEIIFSILFGFLILNEKITKTQLVFSFILLFGVTLAITKGNFTLIAFNVGVIILIIDVAIFTFLHTLTKFAFDRNELTAFQVVFLRNFISGIILISTYFLFFPLKNVSILINPNNYIFFILMGLDYGFSLYTWYKTLSVIGSIAIIMREKQMKK